ncbi:MAG: amidohydrolase, partial [Sphingobacteriales bacterium]
MLKKAGIWILICVLTTTSLFFVGVWWPLDDAKPISTNAPIVIKNVSIIDLRSGSVVDDQIVYIDDKEIKYVGMMEGFEYPKNFIEIDGRDRYVIPALWDMHTHIYKITPLLDLPLYISYGVTNVRDLTSCPKQGDPFASCSEDFRRWNDAAIAGELVGPRIQGISSWQINGPGIHKRIKGVPQFFGTATPLEAREFARYYAGKVDALKVYDYVPRESYFALAHEAKSLGLDLIGHRPYSVSAVEAAYTQKSIEHARFILHESFPGSKDLRDSVEKGKWKEDRRRMIDEHDPEMAAAIFEAMRINGTWYVPTHLTRRQDAYAEDSLVLD